MTYEERLRGADAVVSWLIVAYADFTPDIYSRVQAAMPERNWSHLCDYADMAYCQTLDMAMDVLDRYGVQYE